MHRASVGRSRSPQVVAAVVSGILLAGCYALAPYEEPAPLVGSKVSINFSYDGSKEMAEQVGPAVSSVRGLMLSADATNVQMALISSTDFDAQTTLWKGEEVQVPRVDIREISRREFSIGRTLLATVGVLGFTFLIYRRFNSNNDPDLTGF